jgi:hypothetical protein
MYARFMMARQGPKASKLARAKAEILAKQGDLDGHNIWNEVADAVERGKDSRQQSVASLS